MSALFLSEAADRILPALVQPGYMQATGSANSAPSTRRHLRRKKKNLRKKVSEKKKQSIRGIRLEGL